MKFKVELDTEADGRWLAEVAELPGVAAYGATREEAVSAVMALTFRVIADRVEHGEVMVQTLPVEFQFLAA